MKPIKIQLKRYKDEYDEAYAEFNNLCKSWPQSKKARAEHKNKVLTAKAGYWTCLVNYSGAIRSYIFGRRYERLRKIERRHWAEVDAGNRPRTGLNYKAIAPVTKRLI